MPRPRKRFGQHFLSDRRLLARIADAVGAGAEDTVLEIGPGPGGLTAALLERAGTVIAIEKDRDLAAELRERFPSLVLIEGDALDEDWHALDSRRPGVQASGRSGVPYIAGNIPYNITTPLIDKALEPPRPRRIVFLVQREVADRIAAAPGSRTYGALSAGVQAVARVERLFIVPAGAFHPRPRVDSAVILIEPLASPLVPDDQARAFRRFTTGIFGFRRKQLQRGLRELTGWEAGRITRVLEAAGVDPAARPETLGPGPLAVLARQLVDGGWATAADL